MNNKGFAITGILYTLFILFIMILFSILSSLSYKKGILEKTVLGIEDDYETEIFPGNINNTYIITTNSGLETAVSKINGKFEFTPTTTSTSITANKSKCYVYFKKGEIIYQKSQTDITANGFTPTFKMIPADCNRTYIDIYLSESNYNSAQGLNKIILTNVYQFKG